MTLGQQIRKYRLMDKLSQRELGRLIGVSPSTVYSWEHEINKPRLKMKYWLEKALDHFFDEEDFQ